MTARKFWTFRATPSSRCCMVASPLMLVGLIVGVAISLLQALTQIQETTLVFVPKILAIFLALLVALPFMADALHSNFCGSPPTSPAAKAAIARE